MEQAWVRIHLWASEGRPTAWLCAAALVAICFVVFNGIRTVMYFPQLLSCLRDPCGCRAINLWTWGSWVGANSATAVYLWVFLDDGWGAILNLVNALMCLAIVAVAMVRRLPQGDALAERVD